MDQTIYCHHPTEEAAETHAGWLTQEGFEVKVEPDGERWLVTAHRDDGADDAYTVERLETY